MNTEEPDAPKDFSLPEKIQMVGLLVFGIQEFENWDNSSMRKIVEEGRDVLKEEFRGKNVVLTLVVNSKKNNFQSNDSEKEGIKKWMLKDHTKQLFYSF